jgi:hypothetical protein
MASFLCGRFLACAAAAGAAISLAACSATTYGTGTSPGAQTLKDISGMAALTGQKKEKIDYEPRPSVVVPPTTASLPPPTDGDEVLGTDWPDDPDVKAEQLKADVAALEAEGKHLDVRLPAGAQPPTDPYADLTPAERKALVRKLAAEARSAVAVDENGNPVRRYLSEPPLTYREGDPNAPVLTAEELKKQKKKKKKWWQFWASNE